MDLIKDAISKLEIEIKPFVKDKIVHDISHLYRVMNLGLHIQEKEGGDRYVIAIASFLHDIHRVIKSDNIIYVPPKYSLPYISKIYEKNHLLKDKMEQILHCIEFHEEYNFTKQGNPVDDIETLIVQDADNLDAIGAVGIARVFSFWAYIERPIWLPNIPIKEKDFDESKIDPSTIHHFYSKLLKLKDNMNTKTAKKMALPRHKFMLKFLDEFFKEWRGEA
jgi:uncharacterized protein